MGNCSKCGSEDYALHVTRGTYKFLCRHCYCELYRECVDQCGTLNCPNSKGRNKGTGGNSNG